MWLSAACQVKCGKLRHNIIMKVNKFGEKVAELRKDKGMTQLELSKVLGFSRAAVCDWESRGKEPEFDTLILIAKYFNVSTDYLLGLEDF